MYAVRSLGGWNSICRSDGSLGGSSRGCHTEQKPSIAVNHEFPLSCLVPTNGPVLRTVDSIHPSRQSRQWQSTYT